MSDPLVIGIDSSTTATKAIAFDPTGGLVAEGRASIPLSNPSLGAFEQDPADWWHSTAAALKDCTADLEPSRVKAVAVTNQRETLGFFDEAGEAVRPAMVWLDERARIEVGELSAAVGTDVIHRLTGRMPDLTPAIYRIQWLRKNEPDAFDRIATFCDVQSFIVRQLTGGPFVTSWASADPLGAFDLVEKRWAPEIVSALGFNSSHFPEAHPPGTALGTVSERAASQTGLAAGTPVIAGGGDGQLAGLGTACISPDRAYINLGTAVVSGVWSPTYVYDRAFRSQIAGQGEGYILENCLRSGTHLVNWFVDNFVPGGAGDAAVFARLESEALALPIGSEGVMVLPYWSGVMDPHWNVDARGVILGLSASHKPAHIYRAILEGITLDQVARTRKMETALGSEVDHYLAIGGGAASVLWRQMLADASGREVRISATNEASALGAAMIAAAGAGLHPSIVDAARGMAGAITSIAPDPSTSERYAALLDIYSGLYKATAETSGRLVSFAGAA